MRWARRLLLSALLGGLLVVVGSLASLDWSRSHAAATARLPSFSEGTSEGLVRIAARGFEFRARVAGLDGEGPALVLLHGFPETSAMWKPLIEAAASEGFRVLAFDQRGYSPGARPDAVSAYQVDELRDDILALADRLGFERFHLVGHDWGCVLGWTVLLEQPERVRSYAALSIPHPAVLALRPGQSPPLYVRVFRTPWLPEVLFTFGRLALLRAIFPAATPPEQLEETLAVFAEPGAMTAALGWYRALDPSRMRLDESAARVERPVLFVWGTGEMWVTDEARERQRALMRGPYEELRLEAGHWLIEERPDEIVRGVLSHLRTHRGA